MTIHCPDCRQKLADQVFQCNCGWRKLNSSNSSLAVRKTDFRCEYSINQKRCNNLGGICTAPYAKGPWYCSAHWSALHDSKLSAEIIAESEKFKAPILNWKEELLQKTMLGIKP